MKRYLLLVLLLCPAILVGGLIGCRFFQNDDGNNPGFGGLQTGVEPIRRTGNASLRLAFRLPGQGSPTPGLQWATVADIRVAFILKVINPGHPEEPYTQIRQEVAVVDGTASATFSNLPPNSVVGEVAISSGTYHGFADFHGAIDLIDNQASTLNVSPMGSYEDPDQVAQTIKSMITDPAWFGYVQTGIASMMQTALVESRNRMGTDSAQVVANVRDSYLALSGETPATMNQSLDAAKEFMTGYEVYKDRSYANQPVTATSLSLRSPLAGIRPGGSLPDGIRAAFNSWTWDPQTRLWSFTSIFDGPMRKYAYAYMTSAKDRRFQYITDSPEIDRLVTSTENYVTYSTERATITDANEYIFGRGIQTGSPWFDHIGTTWAKGNTSGRELWRISSNLRNCHIASKYPGYGWIEIWDNLAPLHIRYEFKGTCVARVEILDGAKVIGVHYVYLDFLNGEPPPRTAPNPGLPPLASPLDIQVTATTSNLLVSWSPVSGATGYDLYLSRTPGAALIDCQRVPFVESPCAAGTELSMFFPWYLRVVARSKGLESPPSAEVSGTALPPPPTTGLSARVADGKVLLTWNPVKYGLSTDPEYYSYLILGATQPLDLTTWETAINSAAGWQIANSGNQFEVGSLTNNTTYHFAVLTTGKVDPTSPRPVPRNRYGMATPTEQITATPVGNGVLLPPTNLRFELSYLGCSVSWVPPTWSPTPAALEYVILAQVGTFSGPIVVSSTRVTNDPSGRSTWTYQGTAPKGAVASLAVIARVYPTLLGQPIVSSASLPIQGTIQGPYPVTGSLAVPGNSMNTISWTYPDDRKPLVEKYNLYWSTNPILATASANRIASVSSPFLHTGLTNGTRYFYAVTVDAVNNLGESEASSMVSAIPRDLVIPAVPASVTVTASAGANIISWTPVDLAESYNIYWGNSSQVSRSTGTKISGVTQPPYTHSGLAPVRYYYVITSVGAEGESAESALVSSVPQ